MNGNLEKLRPLPGQENGREYLCYGEDQAIYALLGREKCSVANGYFFWLQMEYLPERRKIIRGRRNCFDELPDKQ